MSQIIKLRAWNAEQEEMLEGGEFYIDFIGQPHQGEVGAFVDYEKDGQLQRREVKLMQFTGLCDKNGKEIWEGDVIEIQDARHQRESIIFIQGAFMSQRPDGTSRWLSNHHPSWFVVIGNIYENPELLK